MSTPSQANLGLLRSHAQKIHKWIKWNLRIKRCGHCGDHLMRGITCDHDNGRPKGRSFSGPAGGYKKAYLRYSGEFVDRPRREANACSQA